MRKIIFHDPTKNYVFKGRSETKKLIPNHKSLFYAKEGKGLPIGNLTSQFFANVYLSGLDHFITDTLGFKKYVRYVDDFVLVAERKETLHALVQPINQYLHENRGLRLHPKKIKLQEIAKGVDFLGYIVRPNYTLVRQKVVKRLKKRVYDFATLLDGVHDEEIREEEMEKFRSVVQSYFGHCAHAESFRLRESITHKVDTLMKNHPQAREL